MGVLTRTLLVLWVGVSLCPVQWWLVQPIHQTYRQEGGLLPMGLVLVQYGSLGPYYPYVYPEKKFLVIILKRMASHSEYCQNNY